MSNPAKEFCFSPISGGYFIAQLAELGMLLEARRGKHFDIYFGASGGNIANILGSSFSITKESLLKNVVKSKPEFFSRPIMQGKLKKFNSIFLGIASYEGLRKAGIGSEEYFQDIFEGKDFNRRDMPEYWTLITNSNKLMGEIACSKSKNNSLIGEYVYEEHMYKLGCSDVHYLDGKTEEIVDVTIASATIPGVRTSVELWDEKYVDGGISSASPGSFLVEPIRRYCEETPNSKVHFFYLTGFDVGDDDGRHKFIGEMKDCRDKLTSHWVLEAFNTFRAITVGMILNDKRTILETWSRIIDSNFVDLEEITYNNVTEEQLKEIIDEFNDKHYFAETMSTNSSVNILDFIEEDITREFKKACSTFSIKIFYIPS